MGRDYNVDTTTNNVLINTSLKEVEITSFINKNFYNISVVF